MKRNGHEKYTVHLNDAQRQELERITRKGTHQSRVILRARVLLASAEGKQDKQIYQHIGVVRSTVHDTRKHYCEGGLSRALYDAPRSGQPRKLNGKQEARVVAIACTKAPKGYAHWTLDLLTETVKEKLKRKISRSALWHVLLRNDTKPWRKKNVVHSYHDAGV